MKTSIILSPSFMMKTSIIHPCQRWARLRLCAILLASLRQVGQTTAFIGAGDRAMLESNSITLWPLEDSLPELANCLMNRVHTLGMHPLMLCSKLKKVFSPKTEVIF